MNIHPPHLYFMGMTYYNGVYHNWNVNHIRRYVNEFTFCLKDGNVQIDTMERIAVL